MVPPTTEIYTLSLHDALPIFGAGRPPADRVGRDRQLPHARPRQLARSHLALPAGDPAARLRLGRSEEHTSELQSHSDLVCRLLLEKKNHHNRIYFPPQPIGER